MAFKVYLYSGAHFTKRKNSTKTPASSDTYLEYDCKLKAPSNISNPVIEILTAVDSLANFSGYGYAYIPSFNRFYFVESWQLDGRLAKGWLKVDTLGTFKAYILASSQYVLRATSDWSGFIKDTKYPIKAAAPTQTGYHAVNPLQPPQAEPTGVFVLGVVSNTASLTGCVSYYALSYTDMLEYMTKIFTLDTQWGTGGQDLAEGLKKAITDPMQYIVSAVWLPYVVGDFYNRNLVTAQHTIPTGYDNITLTGYAYRFNDSVNIEFTNLISLNIPVHPQSAARGNYLNYEPFSRYFLSFYPFCGKIDIDSTLLTSAQLHLLYTVDLRTGKGVLNVTTNYTGSSYLDWRATTPIRVIEAQVGVNIPLATIHTSLPTSLAEFAVNTIASVGSDYQGSKQKATAVKEKSKNFFQKIAAWFALANTTNPESQEELIDYSSSLETKGMGQDLADIATNSIAMKSTVETLGSQGTMSFYNRQIIVFWGDFYTVANDNVNMFGRPLCEVRQLSTLSGFCLCDNPSLEIPNSLLPEKLEIENLMQTGFFIE